MKWATGEGRLDSAVTKELCKTWLLFSCEAFAHAARAWQNNKQNSKAWGLKAWVDDFKVFRKSARRQSPQQKLGGLSLPTKFRDCITSLKSLVRARCLSEYNAWLS